MRNTPTLLDVGEMSVLHMDGEFSSLQEQTHETFVGRNMGWLPDERGEALAAVKAITEDSTGDEIVCGGSRAGVWRNARGCFG